MVVATADQRVDIERGRQPRRHLVPWNTAMLQEGEVWVNRNVIERAFNQLKNWRGIATRYDKHALAYRGGVVLASILLWLS